MCPVHSGTNNREEVRASLAKSSSEQCVEVTHEAIREAKREDQHSGSELHAADSKQKVTCTVPRHQGLGQIRAQTHVYAEYHQAQSKSQMEQTEVKEVSKGVL